MPSIVSHPGTLFKISSISLMLKKKTSMYPTATPKMQKNTVSIDKYKHLAKNSFPETSLKGNDHTLLNNSIDSNEVAENNLLADDLNKAMKTIPSRESKVLHMSYGFDGNPLSHEEISKIMGVSKQRVRDIEAKALRRLRHPKVSKYFVDYGQEL